LDDQTCKHNGVLRYRY